MAKKAVILVLDSFGIGYAPDADKFGDVGANTFASIAKAFHAQKGRQLALPNLAQLGLVKAATAASNGVQADIAGARAITGAYGYARELSSGKDTPSGHWEIAGVPVLFDWGYFHDKTDSFPPELINELCQRTGVPGILGNCHASGTDILVKLGDEHIKTGKPICYTSADSVFQVAAHEEHFGLQKLLDFCLVARELLDKYNIGRVIARPFLGDNANNYARTGNRRDRQRHHQQAQRPQAGAVLDLRHRIRAQRIAAALPDVVELPGQDGQPARVVAQFAPPAGVLPYQQQQRAKQGRPEHPVDDDLHRRHALDRFEVEREQAPDDVGTKAQDVPALRVCGVHAESLLR